MTALTPALIHKLAKIAALFGSEHGGERAAAAALADKLVRSLGMTWADVISPHPSNTIGKVRFALAHIDLLRRWEHGFLLNILRKADAISEKQMAILEEIVAKVLAHQRCAQ